MVINPEWEMLLRDWDLAKDKALAWYGKSWKLKDEDKEIALLYYKKYNKEARNIAVKMNEMATNLKIVL